MCYFYIVLQNSSPIRMWSDNHIYKILKRTEANKWYRLNGNYFRKQECLPIILYNENDCWTENCVRSRLHNHTYNRLCLFQLCSLIIWIFEYLSGKLAQIKTFIYFYWMKIDMFHFEIRIEVWTEKGRH